MIRATKFVIVGILALPIVVIAAVVLFWLGRPDEARAPVEYDFDPDDFGSDVDEDERTP